METNQSTYITVEHYQVLSISLMVLLAAAITLGNVVSLIVFLGSRCFRTPQGYLKVSLALADLAVGILVIPYSVYTEIEVLLATGEDNFGFNSGSTDLGFRPCFLMGPIFTGCTLVSVTTVFLLSVERSITVLKPLQKNVVVTKERTRGLIALSWLFCFFLAASPLLLSLDVTLEYSPCSKMCNYAPCPTGRQHQTQSRSPAGINAILVFPAFDFSVLASTCVVNGVTFLAVRRFCRARATAKASRVSGGPSVSDIRAAKTIIVVTALFCASCVPVAVFVVGRVLGRQWCEFSLYAFWILTCSSGWNVFIYGARDRRFRQRTRELFFGRRLRGRRKTGRRPITRMDDCRTGGRYVAITSGVLRPELTLALSSYQMENSTNIELTMATIPIEN